ncbi:MAG: DNA polymerase III subunit [Mycoplasmatales bacterium]|nr:DNA polymerase III subunit [Mycoplasmatales bacterium]
MFMKNQVRKTNPIAYSTIRNAKRSNKLSHAYLISAEQRVDTSPVANLLLRAIVCAQRGVVACGECSPCKRIVEDKYADIEIVDGTKGMIKKDFIIKATEHLVQTAIESAGKKILYIKNVENANKQSINSLLKFIEEPQPNTFIIMTTNDLNSVLTTIKSRSQTIELRPKNIEILSEQIVEKGVLTKYSKVLANIYINAEDAYEAYEGDFITNFKEITLFMEELLLNKNEAPIMFENIIKKRSDYKLMFEIMNIFLNDIWRAKLGQEIYCISRDKIINKYAESNFDYSIVIEALREFKRTISYNGNFDLAKEKLILRIMEA